MTSGYDKRACGVDPNTEGGRPWPVASATLAGAAIVLSVIRWGTTLWWIAA